MALQNLEFEFESENTQTINPEWSHMGVTGSGDLEVMFTKKDLGGKVQAIVCTPVVGFDAVWEKMLGKFVNDTGVGNIVIEINGKPVNSQKDVEKILDKYQGNVQVKYVDEYGRITTRGFKMP